MVLVRHERQCYKLMSYDSCISYCFAESIFWALHAGVGILATLDVLDLGAWMVILFVTGLKKTADLLLENEKEMVSYRVVVGQTPEYSYSPAPQGSQISSVYRLKYHRDNSRSIDLCARSPQNSSPS